MNSVNAEIMALVDQLPVPAGCVINSGGDIESMQEVFGDLFLAIGMVEESRLERSELEVTVSGAKPGKTGRIFRNFLIAAILVSMLAVTAYAVAGYLIFESPQAMITAIREETIRRLFLVQLQPKQEVKRQKVAKEVSTSGTADRSVKKQPVRNAAKKVGPNDPCPCGSGKKYKKCCMQKEKLGE